MIEGRIGNSMRNFVYGSFSQISALLLGFAVRSIFVIYLNIDYLGVNGLFTSILTALSLAEMGFGTVMNYSLYKPIAHNNKEKIAAYMQLYAKVYRSIGIIVAIIGVSIMPFLSYLIKDGGECIDNLKLLYVLFLSESVFSYFLAYKRSILNADQKAYICSWWHFIALILKSILQIISLIIFSNFIIYILIQIALTVFENIMISNKVNEMYPYLKEEKRSVSKFAIIKIKKNVGALIISNFSRVALRSSSGIIISAFVGLSVVGIYSNYLLIISGITMLTSQIFAAITGSLGNFFAKEDKSLHVIMFQRLDFFNFLLYGMASVFFLIYANPFISLWLGNEYILPFNIVFVISLNFLIEGFLYTFWLFRSTMGLFIQGKYRPLYAAILNIGFSFLLGKQFGLIGVLLGTTISRLCVNAWYDPYIIYKYGLQSSVLNYYLLYILRVLLLFVMGYLQLLLINIYPPQSWFELIFSVFIAVIMSVLVITILFHKTDGYRFMVSVLCNYTQKIFIK